MFSTCRKDVFLSTTPPQNAMCFVPRDKRVPGILENFFPFPVSQHFLYSFPVSDLLKGSRNLGSIQAEA